jgi:hypothetical protein
MLYMYLPQRPLEFSERGAQTDVPQSNPLQVLLVSRLGLFEVADLLGADAVTCGYIDTRGMKREIHIKYTYIHIHFTTTYLTNINI